MRSAGIVGSREQDGGLPRLQPSSKLMKIKRWIATSLSRKLLMVVGSSLLATSIIFMAMFVGMYRSELARGQSFALNQINSLLQVSLENAMLKRDLGGLRQIVKRLGEQEGISQVSITNPAGEVRFSSARSQLGEIIDLPRQPPCEDCGPAKSLPVSFLQPCRLA